MVRYVSPISRRNQSKMFSSSRVLESDKRDDDIVNSENYNDYKDRALLRYAQKLNNNAAMCIEIGYYKKAVQTLQRALQYHHKRSDESLKQVCTCIGCITDGCIDFNANSERNNTTVNSSSQILLAALRKSKMYDSGDDTSDDEIERNTSRSEHTSLSKNISNPKVKKLASEGRGHQNNGGRANSSKNELWNIESEYCDEELEREDEDEEIYKHPIRVLREGHPMGTSLFVVITFNLALAHHLEVAAAYAAAYTNSLYNNPNPAEKALKFYELTSTNEKRLAFLANNSWDSPLSIRLNTFLYSNLVHLSRYLKGKSEKERRSLASSILNTIDEETDRMSKMSYSSQTQSTSSSSKPSSFRTQSSSRNSNRSLRSGSGKSVSRSKSRGHNDDRESSRKSSTHSKSRNHREKRRSDGKKPPKSSRGDDRKSSSKSASRSKRDLVPRSNKAAGRSSSTGGEKKSMKKTILLNALGKMAPGIKKILK